MGDVLDPLKNPVTYAVPFFLLSIVIELLALRFLADPAAGVSPPRTGYAWRDARTCIAMGVISLLFTIVFKIGTFVVYAWLFTAFAPWHLPVDSWWYWVLVIVAVDLGYYAHHRFSHRVRIGWAGHQAHHSSVYMNFGTALRQKWNPWFEGLFWLPLPLLGFAPWTIYVAFGINLIYQFFVHTEVVGRLPAPIEWVFNTPSHHRVHHGCDPEYLDRNYGGILILFDRAFGTFRAERQRPVYGLTHPVTTYNLLQLQYGEYAQIVREVRSARSWRARVAAVAGPPGWSAAD